MERRLVFLCLCISLLLALPSLAQGTPPSVSVDDQISLNGKVMIASINSAGPGWVVIHSDNNGQPGRVIGHAAVAPGWTYQLEVPIDAANATPKLYAVLNVDDGCIPSDLATGTTAEIEEERRLLYVAMTRAKDDLYLIVPQRFFTHQQNAHGDRHVYASRTRFVPRDILHLFEATTWLVLSAQTVMRPASPGVRVDVAARMRGMWR